jgi:hypothetical protein
MVMRVQHSGVKNKATFHNGETKARVDGLHSLARLDRL